MIGDSENSPPAADMLSSSVISVSPSFTAHSSNSLADIAARVVQEFRQQNGHEDDDIFNYNDDDRHAVPVGGDEADNRTEKEKEENNDDDSSDEDEDEDEEFEFAVVCKPNNSSPISADEIFSNGQIVPRYPLFDRSLLLDVDPDLKKVLDDGNDVDSKPPPVVRLPLGKLFSEERDSTSCSSSEADELDGAAPGTYCIWRPKAVADKEDVSASPGRCKKSNSTGNTSKRWKLRDLLHRSNSDGNAATCKDSSLVLVTPLKEKRNKEKVKKVEKTAKVAAAVGDSPATRIEELNIPANKGSRRRSYLPYRQDLVGVFANVNGLSRNLHPF